MCLIRAPRDSNDKACLRNTAAYNSSACSFLLPPLFIQSFIYIITDKNIAFLMLLFFYYDFSIPLSLEAFNPHD